MELRCTFESSLMDVIIVPWYVPNLVNESIFENPPAYLFKKALIRKYMTCLQVEFKPSQLLSSSPKSIYNLRMFFVLLFESPALILTTGLMIKLSDEYICVFTLIV